MDEHRHFSTAGLKQKNKAHKATFGAQSNRGLKRLSGPGRVERNFPSKKQGYIRGAKERRIQRAKQLRRARLDEVTKVNRRLEYVVEPPRVVTLIPLSATCNSAILAQQLEGNSETQVVEAPGLVVVHAGHGDIVGSLDACACADVVVLVMDPTSENDDHDHTELASVFLSRSSKTVRESLTSMHADASIGLCTHKCIHFLQDSGAILTQVFPRGT